MVHLPTLEAMQKEYTKNLKQYIREHSGEFILFEGNVAEFNETFYKTKEELKEATAKYKGILGPTFFTEQIPYKMPSSERPNKLLDILQRKDL